MPRWAPPSSLRTSEAPISHAQLRLVPDPPPEAARTAHAASAPAVATMRAGAEPDGDFSALHFVPCVVCGRELVRIVHGFAAERAAGLFIVEQGWLDFAVYETRRLPEVLRE